MLNRGLRSLLGCFCLLLLASAEAAPVNPIVTLQTNMGDVALELDASKTPVTVKNFMDYVESGFYDGLIFHRVIEGFMIQGGGFNEKMVQASTRAPIKNEASKGAGNQRGTIAMARTNDPDSATAQFFINLQENQSLNYSRGNAGYAVFGRVIDGMAVVDEIAKVSTGRVGRYDDVPAKPVIIKKAVVKVGSDKAKDKEPAKKPEPVTPAASTK